MSLTHFSRNSDTESFGLSGAHEGLDKNEIRTTSNKIKAFIEEITQAKQLQVHQIKVSSNEDELHVYIEPRYQSMREIVDDLVVNYDDIDNPVVELNGYDATECDLMYLGLAEIYIHEDERGDPVAYDVIANPTKIKTILVDDDYYRAQQLLTEIAQKFDLLPMTDNEYQAYNSTAKHSTPSF